MVAAPILEAVKIPFEKRERVCSHRSRLHTTPQPGRVFAYPRQTRFEAVLWVPPQGLAGFPQDRLMTQRCPPVAGPKPPYSPCFCRGSGHEALSTTQVLPSPNEGAALLQINASSCARCMLCFFA